MVFVSATIVKKVIFGDQAEIASRALRYALKNICGASLLLEVSNSCEEAGFAKMYFIAFAIVQSTVAPMRLE